MIKSWKHKGLQKFYNEGITAGIQANHAEILDEILLMLKTAEKPKDMNLPGYNFHALKGKMKGLYAIKVNANWRITFGFEGKDVVLVNYQDYH